MTSRSSLSRLQSPATPVAPADVVRNDDPRLSGSQVVNYYQPTTVQTFTPSAGSSYTATLSSAASQVILVFLNGQQLLGSEWTNPNTTSVVVTPAEGALVASDRLTIVYARDAVFAGSFSQDITVTDKTRGVILSDRTNGNRYRLFMNNGVLGTEPVT